VTLPIVESRCATQGEVAPSKIAPNPLLSREEANARGNAYVIE